MTFPGVSAVFDTDVAVGGLEGRGLSDNVAVFDAASGGSGTSLWPGFARRARTGPITTGWIDATTWPPPPWPLSDGSAFEHYGRYPKVAWIGSNNAQRYFAAAVTMQNAQNKDIDVAVAVSLDGGLTWGQVTNATIQYWGLGLPIQIRNIALAVDPYYISPRRLYVYAMARHDITGQVYGQVIKRYFLSTSGTLTADGTHAPPPSAGNPETLTMTANVDASNTRYLAVAYSDKNQQFACPNAINGPVNFYYRFFTESLGWQSEQLLDVDPTYPECVGTAGVINVARPAIGSTVSPNSRLAFAYPRSTGGGVRIFARQTQVVQNVGTWPGLDPSQIWTNPDAPAGSNEIMPALNADFGTPGVIWYDDRVGSFGSVFGASTTTPLVANLGAGRQIVPYAPIDTRARYMGLSTWFGSSYFFGASHGNGALWLHYDSNP